LYNAVQQVVEKAPEPVARKPDVAADPTRLCKAIERARLALRAPRMIRYNLVEKFVGQRYSEQGPDRTQPINLLSLYVEIVARQLAPKSPRVLLSTFNQQAKPIISAMQTWVNKEIEKTNLDQMFARCVNDALFGMSICKVGIATSAESAFMGWDVDAGEPFAESIDFDDFVFDLHARYWEEVTFIGHRVRRPLQAVMSDKNYSKGRKDLSASPDSLYNQHGDPRISIIGRTVYQSYEEEFEDHVDLWEIFLPRHKTIVTLLSGPTGEASVCEDGDPLRTQDWIGPDHGPYHILALGAPVPGNIMGKGPLQDLGDLHDFVNRLYRKLIEQSQRQKTNLYVRGAADADGNRIVNAPDGEAIRVDDPEGMKEYRLGGPDQNNFQMFVDAVQRFNYMAGNIEAAGGLSPQSKTATQDKMLEASAVGTIQSKQETTLNFVSDVLETLCWFHHHHPQKVMKSHYTLPGLPDLPAVTRQVTPQQRQQISWEDMDVSVDPYSLQRSTPQARAAELDKVVTQIVAPMMQALQAQGINIDLNAYLKKRGELLNMPDLAEIITIRQPTDPSGGGAAADPAGKPPETTRNYVRQSTSEKTPGGQANAAAQRMTTGQPQNGTPMNGAAH
jgi:hypothetical protein